MKDARLNPEMAGAMQPGKAFVLRLASQKLLGER